MTLEFKLFFALILVAVSGFMVMEYDRAIETAAHAETEAFNARRALEAQQTEYNVLKQRYDVQEAVLLEKQGYEEAIRKQLGGVHRKLNDLAKVDPVVRAWSDTPLPPGVRSILRDAAPAGDREGDVHPPAERAPGGDTKPISTPVPSG